MQPDINFKLEDENKFNPISLSHAQLLLQELLSSSNQSHEAPRAQCLC